MQYFSRISPRIISGYLKTILFQSGNNIYDFSISYIRTVFFEGYTQHKHFRSIYIDALFDHGFHHLRSYILSHGIIKTSSGKNNFGMIAVLLRLLCQIIRVHADTMTTYQSRLKRQKVPFRTGSFQDGMSVDAKYIENFGQFVHKSNIDITL